MDPPKLDTKILEKCCRFDESQFLLPNKRYESMLCAGGSDAAGGVMVWGYFLDTLRNPFSTKLHN